MKKNLYCIWLLSTILLAAGPLSGARSFDKLGPYKDVTIKSITSSGIVVFHQDGVATITEAELTDEERQELARELKIIERKRARAAKRLQRQREDQRIQIHLAEQLLKEVQSLPPDAGMALLQNKLPNFKKSPKYDELQQKLADLETMAVEKILSEITALPPEDAVKKLLQARHDIHYARNLQQLRDKLELLEAKVRDLRDNPPESMIRIYRTPELPELYLNWQWSAGHLLHVLKYEAMREHPDSWRDAMRKNRQEKDFFVKELESTHTIRACMIDSAAAVYSITYPSGQSRSFYDSLLNEMLTFYLEKETAKMKAFPGVARQYFRGYREYFRGGYREYGTVRVLLLYTKKELIAADFALCDSSLTSMTLQAVNLDIINFEDFMGSFQARSGYFSLSALTQPPPSTDKTNADNPPADSSGAEDQDQSE